jgi:methylated-DNA-protein-cysteine methyltransferase related protein
VNTNKDFFERVYNCVRLIPNGKVTSYGAIAKYIGAPKSARMVGIALNHSHKSQDYIPAHRVVNRNGILTGKHHFMNINTMEELLKAEGIIIEKDKIKNFKDVFWNPSKNLN